jgi:uncharacterized membrane protein YbhN (UPF0104 family)
MSTSVAGDFETPRPSHRGGAKKAVIVVAKLLVTGACFCYVSRQIDWRQVLSAIPLLDFRWAALAILVAMLEIPLAGLRWYNIVDALAARDRQMTCIAMSAATAVGVRHELRRADGNTRDMRPSRGRQRTIRGTTK